jgi:ankyrin repeat protein
MPILVQRYIFRELNRCSDQVPRCDISSTNLLNLGYCYIDGIGTQKDIETGIALVEKSAHTGCSAAQIYMLNICAADGCASEVSQEDLLRWCKKTATQERRLSAASLAMLDPEIRKQLRSHAATERVGMLTDAAPEKKSTWPAMTADVEVLYIGTMYNEVSTIEEILSSQPSLVDARNSFGQTPLISACQSGSLEAVLYLLRHGANVNLSDGDGFCALHWLISFSKTEQNQLMEILSKQQLRLEAPGFWPIGREDIPFNLHGAPRVNGTALLWAIAVGDQHMAKWLISKGAKTTHTSSILTSALDSACNEQALSFVELMLKDEETAAAVSQYRPLSGSKLTVNALFWVLSGGSRFDRLVRGGRKFEQVTEDLMKLLIKHGVSVEAVLNAGTFLKMSAPFATAYHHCNADMMRSGLAHGFLPYIDSTFGGATSGGPAMSLTIAQKDYEMFGYLIDAGASVAWRNFYKQDALALAAKELDDPWFADKLLERGAPLDDNEGPMTAFATAVYCGNLKFAKHMWNKGADRDARSTQNGMTVLGQLIGLRTKNAAERIQFLLNLPDRDGSDGFEAFRSPDIGHRSSALHVACSPYHSTVPFSEDPQSEETCRLTLSLLLRKYRTPEYVNSTMGPHRDVPLGLAIEIGNHHAVRLLLDARADPDAQDEYGRTPLDKLYWRYCFPSTMDVLKEAYPDRRKVAEILTFVNQNTSEIYSLLKGREAKSSVFRFPGWYESDGGYRTLDWVMSRLKENAEKSPVDQSTPMWGGMPITIPDHPMQFDERRRLARLKLDDGD